jgi:RNA polymerase sigma-70 factor (ECF subfamily)
LSDALFPIRLATLATAAQAETDSRALGGSVACSGNEPSDEALIARVYGEDKEALSLLFRRYARLVRGIAYRVLRDSAEADDLVQDIFLLIYRLAGSFDPSKGSARFWVLQMTYRRAISRRRYLTSRHFYKVVDIDDVAAVLRDPGSERGLLENSFAGLLSNGQLQKALSKLSENQRETIWLFFCEGYTLEEIAAKLGQSRGNVKHHYFRGLERLRMHLFGTKSAQ